ncbi:amidohydrolase family protein [Microbacterium sp.]|uniref:metal-dependent hydrolase family protein n=1 Tax=Microbacterium sp. TaxID=51671 RepID=UPI0033411EE3
MTELLITGGDVLLDDERDPVRTDVLLRDGRIAEVGDGARPAASIDAEERRIDGATLMPGFIDCHVHTMVDGLDALEMMGEPFSYPFYRALDTMRRTLDIGITTVRDAGGADLGLKRAQERGLVEGPALHIAVTILGQTGGHSDGTLTNGNVNHIFPAHPGRPESVVDGPDGMRVRVRELLRAGADVIKICTTGGVSSENDDPRHSQFDADELDVCVRTAAANGVHVMAHAQGRDGILAALRAGVRSIEHGIFADDECFALMKEKGAWLVPTLLAPVALARAIEQGTRVSAQVRRKAYEVQDVHAAMMRRAVAAGVRVAFGTDAGVFRHGINLEEFELMADAGMAPREVLRSATAESADLLGLADRGRIAPGLRADLVVVSGDPYDFGGYADRIAAVIQGGRVVRGA